MLGVQLDLMILEVFSNLNDSRCLRQPTKGHRSLLGQRVEVHWPHHPAALASLLCAKGTCGFEGNERYLSPRNYLGYIISC